MERWRGGEVERWMGGNSRETVMVQVGLTRWASIFCASLGSPACRPSLAGSRAHCRPTAARSRGLAGEQRDAIRGHSSPGSNIPLRFLRRKGRRRPSIGNSQQITGSCTCTCSPGCRHGHKAMVATLSRRPFLYPNRLSAWICCANGRESRETFSSLLSLVTWIPGFTR